MMDLSKIDALARRITDALPPGAKQFREEFEGQLKTLLQKGLQNLDLVTREEFDTQSALLQRATAQLHELEQQLTQLQEMQSPGG